MVKLPAKGRIMFNKLYRTPTKKKWMKVINQIPSENVGLNKDGSYNTKQAPEFRKWLKNG